MDYYKPIKQKKLFIKLSTSTLYNYKKPQTRDKIGNHARQNWEPFNTLPETKLGTAETKLGKPKKLTP